MKFSIVYSFRSIICEWYARVAARAHSVSRTSTSILTITLLLYSSRCALPYLSKTFRHLVDFGDCWVACWSSSCRSSSAGCCISCQWRKPILTTVGKYHNILVPLLNFCCFDMLSSYLFIQDFRLPVKWWESHKSILQFPCNWMRGFE